MHIIRHHYLSSSLQIFIVLFPTYVKVGSLSRFNTFLVCVHVYIYIFPNIIYHFLILILRAGEKSFCSQGPGVLANGSI